MPAEIMPPEEKHSSKNPEISPEEFTNTKNNLPRLNYEEGIWETEIHIINGSQAGYKFIEKYKELFFKAGQEKIFRFLNSFQFSLEDEAFEFTSISKMYAALKGQKDLSHFSSQSAFRNQYCSPAALDFYFNPSLPGRHTYGETEKAFEEAETEIDKFQIAERVLVEVLVPYLDLSQSYYRPQPIINNNTFKGCSYLVYDLSKIPEEVKKRVHF